MTFLLQAKGYCKLVWRVLCSSTARKAVILNEDREMMHLLQTKSAETQEENG